MVNHIMKLFTIVFLFGVVTSCDMAFDPIAIDIPTGIDPVLPAEIQSEQNEQNTSEYNPATKPVQSFQYDQTAIILTPRFGDTKDSTYDSEESDSESDPYFMGGKRGNSTPHPSPEP
jgi:hypothetical protein